MRLLEVLDRPGPLMALGVGVALVVVLLALGLLRARARLRTSPRLPQMPQTLEGDLRAAVRVVRERADARARGGSGLVDRHGDDVQALDLAPGAADRERVLRWIAAGHDLIGLVQSTLRDCDRLRQDNDAFRRECQRLRLELAHLQRESDRLIRERRQLAQALATFVHEAGPRALLDSLATPDAGSDRKPESGEP